MCRKKTRQERLINISMHIIAKLSDVEIQKIVPAMPGRHGGVYFSLLCKTDFKKSTLYISQQYIVFNPVYKQCSWITIN
jgi:hypothetical protein